MAANLEILLALAESSRAAFCKTAGDEIARNIAKVAKVVYHTARTWITSETMQPRHNLHRMPWIQDLATSGEAVFEGGKRVPVDSVVYCTGYKYSFPFLEGSGLIETGTLHIIRERFQDEKVCKTWMICMY